MKKYLKYIGIVISLVALLGIIFFAMDFCRVNNKKNPIFCIKTKVYEDGGTREFLGLGYKVIDFHTINGFYETKIGSYFMKYEDFDDEISKYDNIVIDEIVKSEEYIKEIENAIIKLDLPKEWHYEEIDNPENQNAKFELKLYKDSKEKSASLYYYNEMFGVCGTGLISKKINLNNGNEASVGFYDGNQIWNYVAFGSLNPNIAVLNNGLDESDANELLGIIKTLNLINEQENEKEEYIFWGKVIESNNNRIVVEPNEDEQIRKSADKISIGLEKNNDAIYPVGSIVKITYDGSIMETYPAQINAKKIELKSVDNFNIVFYKETNIVPKQKEVIVSKGEIENINYNIYAYEGHVAINLNSDNLELSDKSIPLREAIIQEKITIEEIIAKANKDLDEKKITGDMIKDGGTMIYNYNNYTIIKCHSLDGNRDVYIGSKDMKISDLSK